jgi:hypothetical protein
MFNVCLLLFHLLYGIEFWGSTCTSYLQQLRVLQKQSIRLICHASKLAHCAPLAYDLKLLLLDDLFLYSLACFMFKVNVCLFPNDICKLFTKLNTVHQHETRSHCTRFFVPQCVCTARFNFVTNKGVLCWNALPSEITDLYTFSQFKKSVTCLFLANYCQ